jgi:hypothetical protein
MMKHKLYLIVVVVVVVVVLMVVVVVVVLVVVVDFSKHGRRRGNHIFIAVPSEDCWNRVERL